MSNTVIFQYNNVEKPYLLLKLDDGNKTTSIGFISLNKDELEEDLPIYDDLLLEMDRFLSSKEIKRKGVKFVLNCKQTTKITTTTPNISDRKIKSMYESEISNKIKDIDKYDRQTTSSDIENGKVFYDFLTDKKYREYFEKLGSDLGFENISVEYLHNYLFNYVSNKTDNSNYIYFHEERGMTSLLVVINNTLCAYSSFENTEYNYRLNVASIVDSHIQGLEKIKLNVLLSNKNIPFLDSFGSIDLGA